LKLDDLKRILATLWERCGRDQVAGSHLKSVQELNYPSFVTIPSRHYPRRFIGYDLS